MESVHEIKSDHVRHMKASIEKLVASGAEEGLLIFETEDGKFVQFTYNPGEGLMLEVSRAELNTQQRGRLGDVEGMQAARETEISFLLPIGVDTDMGAHLADRIFRDVFDCRPSYKVQATLDI